jgi:hypothetical protein
VNEAVARYESEKSHQCVHCASIIDSTYLFDPLQALRVMNAMRSGSFGRGFILPMEVIYSMPLLGSALPIASPPSHYSIERQRQRTHQTHRHGRPSRNNNLLICELRPCIPDQMPNRIEAVKRERQRQREFPQHLQDDRPAGHRSRNAV